MLLNIYVYIFKKIFKMKAEENSSDKLLGVSDIRKNLLEAHEYIFYQQLHSTSFENLLCYTDSLETRYSSPQIL